MNFKSLLDVTDNINDFMTHVYSLTFVGSLVSLIVGFVTFSTPTLLALVTSYAVLLFAVQIVLVVILAFTSRTQSSLINLLMYFIFVSCIGLTLSYIFVTYTFASIFAVLISVSVMFGVLSGYGYFTKSDLSAVGKFCLIGLVGIIVATIVNVFLVSSSLMATAISIIGVLVFSGLIAYDTQKIKNSFIAGSTNPVLGAVSLYLDFINLFSYFLALFGVRK